MRVARRSVLQAASAGALTALLGPHRAAAATPPASEAAARTVALRFTGATNGAATAVGDRVVVEVQGVLWSLPADGGAATALTPPDLEPGRPVLSPDGRRVAMSAYRDGAFHFWVMDADGSGLRRLTDGPFDHRAPAWSPDGRFLACVAESALWLLPVTPDGAPAGPARQLADEPADHPSWSGDSRSLLYQSNARLRLLSLDAAGAPAGAPRTVPVALDHRRPTPVDTVVRAGLLWDATGSPPRRDADILIHGGRITAVEPHRPGRRAARTVDASDATVLPGLWDSHVHPYPYTYGARQGALHLAYGVTTTVSLGGSAYEQARLREDIRAGRLAAPRVLAGGELLDGSRVAYTKGRAHRTRAGFARSLARPRPWTGTSSRRTSAPRTRGWRTPRASPTSGSASAPAPTCAPRASCPVRT